MKSMYQSLRIQDVNGNDICEVEVPLVPSMKEAVEQCARNGVELVEAHLPGAHLHGAWLRGAILVRADLRGAVLSRADLGDSELNEADMRDADLRGANLDGADIRFADMRGAIGAPDDAKARGAYVDNEGLEGYHQPVQPRELWESSSDDGDDDY